MVDTTSVFYGICLSNPTTQEFGFPRTDSTFTTANEEFMGTFNESGQVYDYEDIYVGTIADAFEEGHDSDEDDNPGATVSITNRLTVRSAPDPYDAEAVPSRVPSDHPLAGFIVHRPDEHDDNNAHGLADVSGRFSTRGGERLPIRWTQFSENEFVIHDSYGDVAMVRDEGSGWVLSEQ